MAEKKIKTSKKSPCDSAFPSKPEQSTSEEFKLKPKVGLFSGVAIIVGSIIGSGIFVSPGNLMRRTQSPGLSLTLWGLCGLYSLLGALSYCEIGTLVPKSGGSNVTPYVLVTPIVEIGFGSLNEDFGSMLAFSYCCNSIFLRRPMGLSILSLAFAKYLSLPIWIAFDICPDSYLFFVMHRLVACLCICVVGFTNCYSVTIATRVQNVFTIAKLIGIGIIISGGLYNLNLGLTENLEIGFEGSTTSFNEIAQAFYGGLFAYSGWSNLNTLTEEIHNPNRNLPLAIAISLPLTIICYVLVNVSYLTVLTPKEIISSSAVAADWGAKVLGPARILITIGVVLSVYGTANCSMFTAVRISHVAGREGHVPHVICSIHVDKRTPVIPVLLNSFIAFLLIIPWDIGILIDAFSYMTVIFECGVMASFVIMRFTKKNDYRPIKVPIICPLIVMVTSAFLVIAPLISNPRMEFVYCAISILASFVVYFPLIHYQKSVPGTESVSLFLQKLLLVAPTTGY